MVLPGKDRLERGPTPQFLDACVQAGPSTTLCDLPRLERYLDLLDEANAKFNLTAIRDRSTAWMRHIFDSLTLLPWLVDPAATRVADVGSGGGLPGFPLAIALPEVSFTLIEATKKKAEFLRATADALELSNVTVIADRAELVGQDRKGGHRERYDAVIVRAVGRLSIILELGVPLLRVGGILLAIKGEQASAELTEAEEAMRLLRTRLAEQARTETGTILVVEKVGPTVRMYPRAPGEPGRAPLGQRVTRASEVDSSDS